MKLYDFNPDGYRNAYVSTIETFDGGRDELAHKDVTKSFPKAKREALKRLQAHLEMVNKCISEVESMTEESVPWRVTF